MPKLWNLNPEVLIPEVLNPEVLIPEVLIPEVLELWLVNHLELDKELILLKYDAKNQNSNEICNYLEGVFINYVDKILAFFTTLHPKR